MRTLKVVPHSIITYEKNSVEPFAKIVNEYIVLLTEEEYCKIKRKFKEARDE